MVEDIYPFLSDQRDGFDEFDNPDRGENRFEPLVSEAPGYGVNGYDVTPTEQVDIPDEFENPDSPDYGFEPPASDEVKLDYIEQRNLEYYEEKNEYLRNHPDFQELNTDMFLRVLFCRGDNFEELPFEDRWCESYEWWTENDGTARQESRPAKYKYVYNGIAQAIYGKRQKEKPNKTFVITSQADCIPEVLTHPFVLMSPISYTGKRRTKNNSRYLYAMGIDIDSVDADNVANLLFQSDPTRRYITFPQPNIIVNSGGGMHIYYLLETPHPMFRDAYTILNKIKRELTRRVWNKGTTHENPEKPQYQGNCQGFRLPGTKTKLGRTVTAFQNLNPNVKPYYTLEDLAYGGGGFLSDEEVELLRKGTYDPQRLPLKQARELYPEWYERRIIQRTTSGRWYVKRDLYDWWKQKIMEKASVGHRYFCLMTLAIYAKKCRQLTLSEYRAIHAEKLKGLSDRQIENRFKKYKGVTEEEFRKDLEEFVAVMDGLSLTQKPEDRFTLDDALDAAAAYQDSYATFPREDLSAITGIPILKNQTRKYRNKFMHLLRASYVRDGLYPDWTLGRGRDRKQAIIYEWREDHPDGSQYACAKELGIDKKTVRRWWNTTAEEVQAYQEQKQEVKAQKLHSKETADEQFVHFDNNLEIPGIGAEVNAEYQAEKKYASFVMSVAEGHESVSEQEKLEVGYDLADAMENSGISIENIIRMMGFSEDQIPILKANLLKSMQDPVEQEKFRRARAAGLIPKRPKEIDEALNSVVELRQKTGKVN